MKTHPPVMLITGGTGSIGMEIARQALAQGWAVIVQGRSPESVDAAVLKLEQSAENGAVLLHDHGHGRVCGVVVDINKSDDRDGAIARLVAAAGER